MKRGVMFALIAGALWGGVIVAPSLVPEFNPLLISCTRFALYGAVSLLIALPTASRLLKRLSRRDLIMLARLSMAGNIVTYALVSAAVQLTGVATASLVNGILPVAIVCMARSDHGSLPLQHLRLPLLVMLTGLLIINLDPTAIADAGNTPRERAMGIVCGICAVLAWSWFATANARYLRHSDFNSQQWSTLCGIATGVLAIAIGGLGMLLFPQTIPVGISVDRWQTFLWVCLFLAVGGSWLTGTLWNAATRRMPMSLGGQLIVFETLFACVYGFALAQRFPTAMELLAISLLTGGVAWAIRLHRSPGQPAL